MPWPSNGPILFGTNSDPPQGKGPSVTPSLYFHVLQTRELRQRHPRHELPRRSAPRKVSWTQAVIAVVVAIAALFATA
jgi:hypothetical protein